jgi:phosphoserine phosphatase
MAYQRWDLRAERFHNRRTVQAVARRITAVEDRAGAWLLRQTAWLRDQAAATVERIDATQRAAGRAVSARLAAGLAWLEVNDPARSLVAWLRLARAMRKARAALAARTTDQARPVASNRDGGRR